MTFVTFFIHGTSLLRANTHLIDRPIKKPTSPTIWMGLAGNASVVVENIVFNGLDVIYTTILLCHFRKRRQFPARLAGMRTFPPS